MKISFSTLACPEWPLAQVLELGARAGYKGIELRFLEGEDSLWKLPEFRGVQLADTRRRIADSGLVICCVDTSCRFDSPDQAERERWLIEGERMADLAAQLEAPGIRVFGDRIQPGATRETTRNWIVDSLMTLAERITKSRVEVWLETHGDFAGSSDVLAILSACPKIKLVWDPVAAFVEQGERPLEHGKSFAKAICHAHIKDIRKQNGGWCPALTGEGEFPIAEMRTVLESIHNGRFLSFEWEKKWHPEIESADIAIPHFAQWFRTQWDLLAVEATSPASGACS